MDTAGLPEMDGAAAGHPGSPELESDPDRGLVEPGRREARSSETAAAAEAVADRAEGLRAERCNLQREERTESLSHLTSKHSGYLFVFLNPDHFYSYQSTAYRTAAAAEVGHLVAEAGIHLEPGTADTPDLKRQGQTILIYS